MTFFDINYYLGLILLGTVLIYARKKSDLIGYRELSLALYLQIIFIIVYQVGITDDSLKTLMYLATIPLSLAINLILLLLIIKDLGISTKFLKIITIIEIILISQLFVLHFTGLIDLDIYIKYNEYYSNNVIVETTFTTVAILSAVYLLYLLTKLKHKNHFTILSIIFVSNIIMYILEPYYTLPYFLLTAFFTVYGIIFCFGNDQGIMYKDKSKILSSLDIVYLVMNNNGIIVKIDGSNQMLHQTAKRFLNHNYEESYQTLFVDYGITKVEENVCKTPVGYIERYEKIITKHQKVAYFRNVTDEYVSNDDILELSYIDELTKLSNRKALYRDEPTLDFGVKRIIFFDLNKLKYINDNYSHKHGDRALVHFARNLESFFINSRIYRLGGDEFLVLTKKNESQFSNFVISDFYIEEELIELTTSMGYIDCSVHPNLSIREYLLLADKAMYISKKNNQSIVNYDDVIPS